MEKTIKMLIGKVKDRADGGWNVAFFPDNATWISVDPDQVDQVPRVGDEIEVVPPRVVAIRRIATN